MGPEDEVDVQAALVRLVDNARSSARSRWISASRIPSVISTHLVRSLRHGRRTCPNGVAQRARPVPPRDALGDRARGEPARLGVTIIPRTPRPGCEADLWQLCRLPRTGLARRRSNKVRWPLMAARISCLSSADGEFGRIRDRRTAARGLATRRSASDVRGDHVTAAGSRRHLAYTEPAAQAPLRRAASAQVGGTRSAVERRDIAHTRISSRPSREAEILGVRGWVANHRHPVEALLRGDAVPSCAEQAGVSRVDVESRSHGGRVPGACGRRARDPGSEDASILRM